MILNRNPNIDENDCCGNGCVNCILYTKPINDDYISKKGRFQNIQNCLKNDKYTNFQLIEKLDFNPKLIQLKFECVDKNSSDEILFIPSGYHIMMKTSDNSQLSSLNSSYITRPYSPFWIDEEKLQFKILVNLSPNGKMSNYIKNFKQMDIVEILGPIGGAYKHNSKSCKNLLVFTHGVAITSVIRICDEILDDENDLTRIHLYACFSNIDNVILREKIYDFNLYWNFNSTLYLAHQNCDECKKNDLTEICEHVKKKLKYNESVKLGRLNENCLKDALKLIDVIEGSNYEIVISGSKEFIKFIEDNLRLLNANKDCIFAL